MLSTSPWLSEFLPWVSFLGPLLVKPRSSFLLLVLEFFLWDWCSKPSDGVSDLLIIVRQPSFLCPIRPHANHISLMPSYSTTWAILPIFMVLIRGFSTLIWMQILAKLPLSPLIVSESILSTGPMVLPIFLSMVGS